MRPPPAQTVASAVSFRSLTTKAAADRDAATAMCDIVQDIVWWMERNYELPSSSLPDCRNEDPEIAAERVRQEWGRGIRPIKNMIALLEAKGVRILSLAENCREIDACSFWADSRPYILLNPEVSNERLRFDLAHELAHLVLHRHGAPSGQEAEKEANRFASEFLMPEASVRANRPRVWSLSAIIERKAIWNVSAAALTYRVHQLGQTSPWQNKSLNIELRRRGFKEKEPNSSQREQSSLLEAVLGHMRSKGMGLSFIANQTALPVDEVRSYLWGLAKVAVEGLGAGGAAQSGAHLRVVK